MWYFGSGSPSCQAPSTHFHECPELRAVRVHPPVRHGQTGGSRGKAAAGIMVWQDADRAKPVDSSTSHDRGIARLVVAKRPFRGIAPNLDAGPPTPNTSFANTRLSTRHAVMSRLWIFDIIIGQGQFPDGRIVNSIASWRSFKCHRHILTLPESTDLDRPPSTRQHSHPYNVPYPAAREPSLLGRHLHIWFSFITCWCHEVIHPNQLMHVFIVTDNLVP